MSELTLRMKNMNVKNNVHCYKPYIVTIRSSELLKYINVKSNFEDKIALLEKNDKMLYDISKDLYKKYNPNLIYTFNNEINLVFYYNENGDYIFNGDINKTITNISSYATLLINRYYEDTNTSTQDFIFTGNLIEFDKDYEVLNYIVWRQYDCKRNVSTFLYNSYYNTSSTSAMNVKLKKMLNILRLPDNILTGNIIKKHLYYKDDTKKNNCTSESDILVTRKHIRCEKLFLNINFRENFQKYIVNKIA